MPDAFARMRTIGIHENISSGNALFFPGKTMKNIIHVEIDRERIAQDQQWGGAEHDDRHATVDWLDFISHQIVRARMEWDDPMKERARFIKIAALSIAAVESIDRRNGDTK